MKIVDVSENTARAISRMHFIWKRQYKAKAQYAGLLPTTSAAGTRVIVIQKYPRDPSGKTWLKCRRIIAEPNIYDTGTDPAKDVVVYAGVNTAHTCGDEIVVLPIAEVPQGSMPYPSRLYPVWNFPVDQVTLDEPSHSCVVASPVPCVSDPPDPDPCLQPPP